MYKHVTTSEPLFKLVRWSLEEKEDGVLLKATVSFPSPKSYIIAKISSDGHFYLADGLSELSSESLGLKIKDGTIETEIRNYSDM